MTDIARIRTAEPIVYGVLKITWSDGYEGVVDLRPVLETGPVFAFLRDDHSRFLDIQVAPFGNSIGWTDDDGETVDLGTDALRRRADDQAELLRRAG